MDGPRRHRSSTAASSPPLINDPSFAELRNVIESLRDGISSTTRPSSVEHLQTTCDTLRRTRQLLIDAPDPGQAKDVFRYAGGFSLLLETVRSVSGVYNPSKLSEDEHSGFLELLRTTLDVLSEALKEHTGNRRYFTKRVDSGGWQALEQALGSTGIAGTYGEGPQDDDGQEHLFGYLFAFALGEDNMTGLFRGIANVGKPRKSKGATANDVEGGQQEAGSGEGGSSLQPFKLHLKKSLSGKEILQNPEIMPAIFSFWQLLSGPAVESSACRALSISILLAIQELVDTSTHNKAAVHSAGLLSAILPLAFGNDKPINPECVGILRELSQNLITFGVNSLQDAQFLYRQAVTSEEAAEFLLKGVQTSRGPAFIQFDLSLQGFSSVELRDLGRTFPPTTPASGYSFTAWIRVDKYDSNCHTTIFGACDASQTCFVLAYIEKDTRNFILQPSNTASKPSVRFRSTVFKEGVWYHIALVHKRPKIGPSRASLFINGEFAEQVKCHYPASPSSLTTGSTESFASLSSSINKHVAVQAFLGTPQDLAPRLGTNVTLSRLSIASFHLFQEALSDEMVAVYQKLGPRYSGNYQDCLGSFQTYRASAELNLYNELLHPGKEEKSEIISAIRLKARDVLSESRLLLSLSPASVMDDDDSNAIDESQLIKSLSKNAAKNLYAFTRIEGLPVVINGAVPSINDALTQPHGVASLLGSPVVVVPRSLDDAVWGIGGCTAVGLKLVELATTKTSIIRAVKILLESIDDSWRNSEAMEKENGFQVLAGILRDKMGLGSIGPGIGVVQEDLAVAPADRRDLAHELLRVILRFIGYDEDLPHESLIINPLAYRILLVDFDMWRKAAIETQKLYYEQFIHFATGSKHHHFNSKRLTRMRIVKKLLDALKGESISAIVFPHFIRAFKVLLSTNMSGDSLRSLSLFVTYALHDSRAFSTKTLRPRSSLAQLRNKSTPPAMTPAGSTPRSGSPSRDPSPAPGLSRADIGIGLLEMFADLLCEESHVIDLRKFARHVTNKWLLYLLAEDDTRVVILGMKILARLLVIHGPSYVKKFSEKSGGFVVIKQRLKKWWNVPSLWTICFAVLFGWDVATVDLKRDFNLTDIYLRNTIVKVVYPDILPVLTAMLEEGLRFVVDAPNDSAPSSRRSTLSRGSPANLNAPAHTRRRSMSLGAELAQQEPRQSRQEKASNYTEMLQSIISFLSDLYDKSEPFREFTTSSNYVQELLFVLYPVIVTSDTVSAETELLSRGSALTFEGQDVIIKSPINPSDPNPLIIRAQMLNSSLAVPAGRAIPLRRGSSFILISTGKDEIVPSAKFMPTMAPEILSAIPLKIENAVVDALLQVLVRILTHQVFHRKEFPGFGLFLKVPPSFQEHQAYFESYVFLHAMSALSKAIHADQKILCEPKALTNMARYVTHMAEAIFEGWFLNGAEPLLDFIGGILDYLQRPDIARIKSVRLCAQNIATIRTVFLRVVLLRLSDLDEPEKEKEAVEFLDKMIYWQTIILSPDNAEVLFVKLISYLLYTKLVSPNRAVALGAANFWRLLLVQKPVETSAIMSYALNTDQTRLSAGFLKLVELDNDTFLAWVDAHRTDLNAFFFSAMSKTWEDFVTDENRKTEETTRNRLNKRKERLKQWQHDDNTSENIWHRHEVSTTHWRANIHAAERLKHQRAQQDQQDNISFITSVLEKLDRTLRGPCSLFATDTQDKWELDETEGRNRMRMRIVPDYRNRENEYQPKRKESDIGPKTKISIDTKVPRVVNKDTIGASPIVGGSLTGEPQELPTGGRSRSNSHNAAESGGEEDFEIVDDPNEGEDGFEDKNRKVMRSLQHGDQVQHVFNVARIVGLEAIEGLLIVGKDSLYLLDNFFQRSDGEIVRVWQAPAEERDAYLQMISGRQTSNRKPQSNGGEQTTRNWKWADAISISKRRFLFRDVAIEIFFIDGRSYLLTAISPSTRNDLYTKLISRAPHLNSPLSSLNSEDAWRLESIRNPEEVTQSLGSRFSSVFNSASSNPATKKWLRGEISNFHYLMLINTLAGRTFNDLTQYPVFPWVLADYSSQELDLTNPRTFRDFSKPMGCQTPSREAEFRERYQSFAEMGDHNAPPFHYGTHYSSAMIVTSYLIRLQPFVQSYLLLQGGSFDHADRLFYSIEKAWLSASRDNMTDVRELTPEFFYLPEFLKNVNGYNFGFKQGSGEKVDDVILPPWAKGDPDIFIAKHREALESPYVTRNLHRWIDLVFGFKQRGEAAIEATNVFQHLSYHGARDLDNIEDPVERLAAIGIIHNFGQTPHQVFQKAHVPRDDGVTRPKRLDYIAESLIRLPFPLLDSRERVSSLLYSSKQDRLLCSAAFRLNIPPSYERHMEWGFTDNSLRFYSSDKRLIALFEHVHHGQISCATFVDGKTLITAGTDCTIAIWNIVSTAKSVDVHAKLFLFGHRSAVTILEASAACSTFLSASGDGRVYLWDLNRCRFLRELGRGTRVVQCAKINNITGRILLCSGPRVLLYTLNGRLLLEQNICDTADPDDIISCCAFYEGVGNEWMRRELIFTGHRRGVVNIWKSAITPQGTWTLNLIKRLNHVDAHKENGSNFSAAMTCILPMSQVVYTGDDDGRVFEWNCVQRA